jgi:hypothetical protein
MRRPHTTRPENSLGCSSGTKCYTTRSAGIFTEYPKLDTDDMVKQYFAMDGHICARVKMRQAENARRYGDAQRAMNLENAARDIQARWLGRRP